MAEVPMSEANLGLETKQPTDVEIAQLNQEGIVVVEQPQKPGFFRNAVRRLGVPGVLATSMVLAACSGGDAKTDQGMIETPTIPAATGSITPEKGTPVVVETATPTPEKKTDVPCQILPQEYCNKAELIERKGVDGQIAQVIALKLSSGIPIFSPIDGEVAKAKTNTGLLAVIRDPNDPNLIVINVQGDIKFDNMLTIKVKKGDVVGYTQDTGEFTSPLGDYNIRVGSTKASGDKIVDNPDKMKEFFPEAFKKGPVKKVDLSSSSNNSSPTPVYLPPTYETK